MQGAEKGSVVVSLERPLFASKLVRMYAAHAIPISDQRWGIVDEQEWRGRGVSQRWALDSCHSFSLNVHLTITTWIAAPLLSGSNASEDIGMLARLLGKLASQPTVDNLSCNRRSQVNCWRCRTWSLPLVNLRNVLVKLRRECRRFEDRLLVRNSRFRRNDLRRNVGKSEGKQGGGRYKGGLRGSKTGWELGEYKLVLRPYFHWPHDFMHIFTSFSHS